VGGAGSHAREVLRVLLGSLAAQWLEGISESHPVKRFQVVVTTNDAYSWMATPLSNAGFANCIRGNVRRQLIQFGTTLILAVCLWGHVSEIFDHWDNTLQTGNDIEYSTVIVALIAGAVFWLAQVAAKVIRARSATFCLSSLFVASLPSTPSPVLSIGHSPPQPLRI
jgi:hypothetical protein